MDVSQLESRLDRNPQPALDAVLGNGTPSGADVAASAVVDAAAPAAAVPEVTPIELLEALERLGGGGLYLELAIDPEPWGPGPEPLARLADLTAPGGPLEGWERGCPAGVKSRTWADEVHSARNSDCAHCGGAGLTFLPYTRAGGGFRAVLLCGECGHAHY